MASNGHLYIGVLCRDNLSINIGFGEVLDLREVYKGEEVTVGVAIIAPAIVSPFQGLGKL